MLGIDITKISRFKNAKDTLIKKILHPKEITKYQESENKAKFLAIRFAIKEALFKANNSNFIFSKIEIQKKNRVYQYPGYVISTSNEDDYYIAIVKKEK